MEHSVLQAKIGDRLKDRQEKNRPGRSIAMAHAVSFVYFLMILAIQLLKVLCIYI